MKYKSFFSSIVVTDQESLIDHSVKIDVNLQTLIDIIKEISSSCDNPDFHPLITVYLCQIYQYLGIFDQGQIDDLNLAIIEISKELEEIESELFLTKILISWGWVLLKANKEHELKELFKVIDKIDLSKYAVGHLLVLLPFYAEKALILSKIDQKRAIEIWKTEIKSIVELSLENFLKNAPEKNNINTIEDNFEIIDFRMIFSILGEYYAEFFKSLRESGVEMEIATEIAEIQDWLFSLIQNSEDFQVNLGSGLSRLFLLGNGKILKPDSARVLFLGLLQLEESQQKQEIAKIVAFTAIIAYGFKTDIEFIEESEELSDFIKYLPISDRLAIMFAKSQNEKDKYYRESFKTFMEPILAEKKDEDYFLQEEDYDAIVDSLIDNFYLLPSKKHLNYIFKVIKKLKPSIKKLELLGKFISVIAIKHKFITPEILKYVEDQLKLEENFVKVYNVLPLILELNHLIGIYQGAFLLVCKYDYKEYSEYLKLLNNLITITKEEAKKKKNQQKNIDEEMLMEFSEKINSEISKNKLFNIIKALQIRKGEYFTEHNDYI